ncbi:Urease [Streptococcus thermophilus CNCM I-1630]|nr:Urease [Streptococcus thermophilus CNCM I-1630]
MRDGMGVSATETRDNPSVVDTIITGATIIDYTGIIKSRNSGIPVEWVGIWLAYWVRGG